MQTDCQTQYGTCEESVERQIRGLAAENAACEGRQENDPVIDLTRKLASQLFCLVVFFCADLLALRPPLALGREIQGPYQPKQMVGMHAEDTSRFRIVSVGLLDRLLDQFLLCLANAVVQRRNWLPRR